MLPSLKPTSGVVRVCVPVCLGVCALRWLKSDCYLLCFTEMGTSPRWKTKVNISPNITPCFTLPSLSCVALAASCDCPNNFSDLFSVFLKELIFQCLLANQTLCAVLQTHKTLTAFIQIPPKLFWKIFFYLTFFLILQNHFIPTVKRTCCWPDIKKQT